MKTVEEFDKYYEKHGLLNTIQHFCKVTTKYTGYMIGYTFDHIVLGDYNLSDGNINFCLEQNRILDWIYDQYKSGYAMNYTSNAVWENYGWYDLIETVEIIVLFLKWLKTINIHVRENVYCEYE